MLSKTRIGTICYYVSDIARTEAFYRSVLGLDVQRMGDDGAGNDWLMASIENNVDLIFFVAESKPGNTPIIVFDLAEGGIDDVVGGLAEKGATIVTPVSHAPGGWSAEFADPDGHVLSIYQPAEAPRTRSTNGRGNLAASAR
ncbi:glyoxalase/bleomycin resistance/dioxygenase family protein [Mesorhizobium plurifarium]|uniref:VOC family protein n=1 Tax=Sinorhizobium arboris TaxID=76745 RepID=UPI0004161089|nr:VOC family protein [Sinorhizobium arboris]PST26983.1 glyoxalase/bleomycin resistance/dioxygenase family protein [Mesorhizobium plurifarium]PST27469.1 glyoxalase/bleomycin resistance/dioxygenase family protein [Mesorhizobium plurifarium]